MHKISSSILLASFLALSTAGLVGLSSTGCDGGGGGGSGGEGGSGGSGEATCFDYSSFDGTSPTVSFKDEVLPLFQRSCGITTGCHGDPNQPDDKRPYLGPKKTITATADDIAIIRGAIIDVTSYYEPTMSIVASGDPEKSFLMHKIDFTLECDLLTCGKDCGVAMPQGNEEPLALAERNLVRRWIAQGALDN